MERFGVSPRLGRVLACLVAAAVTSSLIPQAAYAASGSDGDGGGFVDNIKSWFADDSKELDKPSSHNEAGVAERQKLPKGRAAPKAKRVAELTGKRTANTRLWKLSDGRVQAEVSAVPTAYRAGKSWRDIDVRVKKSGRDDYRYANTANALSSWFGSDADRLMRVESADGHAVTLGLEGAKGSLDPLAKGDTVTYRDAVAGADLSYEVGPGRVKENITLAERPDDPVKFTFTLDTDGLTPKAAKDGSIAFYGEGANPVLVIPAPFMADTKKDAESPYGAAYSTALRQQLSRDGKGWKLTVVPDAKWLASPKRQYPVTIDPTIQIAPTPSTAQDVMISSDGPASNYDTNWRLSVGNTSTGSSRALLKFPLTGVPAGAKLDSADLKLYYDQTHTTGDTEVHLEAHRATADWSEDRATWNSAGGITGELSGTSVLVDDGDAGTTAAKGSWPASGNTTYTQYAVNQDYLYNKDSVAGDTYTWQPNLPEDGDYQVQAHYVPASDRATTAPYTVTYNGGSKAYTVNQQAGSAGMWKTLGTHPFKAGTTGKIVLGDGPASTATSVIADAVRFTKGGVVTKQPSEVNVWHSFPVTKTVQSWIDGTNANYGFVVKAGDESANGPKGGPRYEGSEYAYEGETANYPRLVLTYGRPGVELEAPTTIHDTGAALKWSAYTDPSTATGDDIVEYQVHRSIYQTFTPSATTLVSPVAKTSTSYTDTSATPTAADSADPFGRAYYYMVAVKTADGQVVGAPTQLVRLPKAGRTTKIVEAAQDTTLSQTESTTPHDTLTDGIAQKWLAVGNNSPTYGTTRALLKFPVLDIPTSARVLDATMRLWGTQTTTENTGAVYEMRPLSRDFDEASATWVKANSTTNWTTAGGDFGATVADTVPALSNDPARHDWSAASLVQSWVSTPGSNQGVLLKMANESVKQERTVFLSSEAPEKKLRPRMVVTYIDSTTESTYYAPKTPARMTPNSTYTVEFTLTNTTDATWTAADQVLSYTWKLPDGTDKTTGGNQVQTALPEDVAPGETVTLQAQVNTPINSDNGNKRTDYVLTWDLFDKTAGTWLSAGTGGIAGLQQNVAVEDPTSNSLGLEKFYSYTGKNTGAGSTVMNNLAAGNSVWSYNAFTNPGRGLTTFARFSYNSLDTSDTVLGGGWSAQLAGPIRLGAALDFHPNPNPTEIRLPDGDGTTHVFTKQDDGTWKAPAGVHYKVSMKAGLDCTPDKDPVPDAWTLLRPDGTRFYFGCDGYLTSVVDKNGNTQTYTYEERKSNNKPTKFLSYITDPAGRQSLTVEYYSKAEATSPKIADHVKSITDISTRKLTFEYSDQGLLAKLTDGAGSSQPKVFGFTYDSTQGNKNVKLVKVTDPRGHDTALAYYAPQTGDDPKYHWWTKKITDRLGGGTDFAYAANTTNTKFTDTTVTDAESHATKYVADDFGRPVQTTNAKSQTTKMSWDADNNVTYLEEDNGAKTAFCYDQKTGYPLWQRDAENNKNGVPAASDCAPGTYPANAATYEYQTRADGFAADLFRKTSPEGRAWQFGYDTFGNLKTVTDPKGVATTTAGDYTASYDYDAYGQLSKATDANGNPTSYSGFDANGYPETITDAKSHPTLFDYDERGQVLHVTDADSKVTTQSYDTFGRPTGSTVPKDQATGDLITTPAPEYDANDNVTKSTSPGGAVSTAVYDDADQVVSATAPKDSATSDERKTTYTYDRAGNLRTTTEPKGSLTTSDTADYVTTNNYDAVYQLTSVVNAKQETVSYEYDNVGNLVTVIDPKKNATAVTTDYTTKTAYDLNHRVTTVTDATGKFTKRTYDKDSLVLTTTDAENNTTTVTYDERGMQSEVKVPYEGTTTRSTKYEYDQVGNVTKVITPRGAATANADDFAVRTAYDELNRPVRKYQPYDPNDGRYNNPNVYTETTYDKVGRVAKTSLPPSDGETVRNDTTYTYFDNGWVRSSTDPWDIAATYEYNELGLQTARTLTSAGGSSNRTMTWSYYPDGKLKSKSDDGVPVGKSVVLVDNSDTQNTSSTGTWTAGNITGQQGPDHRTHAAGTGTDAFTWTLNIPKDGTYTAYVKYPKVTGATTSAKYTLTRGTTTEPAVTKDQTAGTDTWVSLGTYTLKQGEDTKLKLDQSSGGIAVADAVKLVRDNAGETDNEKKSFAYAYDVNGNLTSIDDTSSGAKIDAYTVAYTGLNQVQKVTEALAGQEKKATSYTYDANGLVDTVTHPDQFSEYTYDLRDLVATVEVGKSATDTSPKRTTYTYTDRGLKLKETKANGNTVDYAYYLNAALKTSTEKKSNGTLVASHTYAYDANGNKAQDVAKKMNADNNTAYLESTTNYGYDPVDRLKESVKTGNGAGTETYVHDDNANVIRQTVKGTETVYEYDRNRLLTATISGVAAKYNYDPFGRMESVVAADKVIERSTYDGFDHVVKSEKMDDTGALKATTYTFDPLDRTASKTADAKTTDFTYLGLSTEVLDEKVAGELTKSYQYSPWGERLSQIKHNSDGTTEDGYYGYNSHTDVETLTDKDGNAKATYGYTAYGKDDETEFTGIDKPDAADPTKEAYNPYRYNAKRWDAQSGTYDMGFRDYNPGLNRFTTRDMYNGALADMGLGVDPYTGNRYAFTGGNPTSRVEHDGHMICSEPGVCGGDAFLTNYYEDRAAEEFVQPGEGEFYENDTPLDAPQQQKEDNRPFNTSNWFMQWLNQDYDLGLWTYMNGGVQGLRHYMGYDVAADLLDHWLGASGDAYELDPKRMMDDMPSFQKLIDDRVAEAEKSGGNYDSGWSVGTSVADFMEAGDKGAAVQGWWYALNGFQYRVKSGGDNKTITVEIFKRYNWGNPTGGAPRGNVGLFEEINQNDLAQLHTDGYAQDFNVWGSYSYQLGG
ncbi:golvesin C-terminal-like domain-containing protein [Streptomyces himalayensis]|uniref:DNRLRE domain-containing protein n=1 Tax=Streptomyces himalayensis subsp. himalayensis TaxID=2756131 RepID=A0A7W0DM32_9ACTN|nr:DNRLRE domain-containing protein [Streptomyces himalayensis]MBA2947606.1 DNRLRE domain-containing protein [Streptomyces himalayensis subsp. himalayensis]